jgi:hypothetical protein
LNGFMQPTADLIKHGQKMPYCCLLSCHCMTRDPILSMDHIEHEVSCHAAVQAGAGLKVLLITSVVGS